MEEVQSVALDSQLRSLVVRMLFGEEERQRRWEILRLLSFSERAGQCSVWVFLSYLVWVKILLPALASLAETISPIIYARDRAIEESYPAVTHVAEWMQSKAYC